MMMMHNGLLGGVLLLLFIVVLLSNIKTTNRITTIKLNLMIIQLYLIYAAINNNIIHGRRVMMMAALHSC